MKLNEAISLIREFGVFNSFHKEMNDNDIINRVKWHWEHCPERKER